MLKETAEAPDNMEVDREIEVKPSKSTKFSHILKAQIGSFECDGLQAIGPL